MKTKTEDKMTIKQIQELKQLERLAKDAFFASAVEGEKVDQNLWNALVEATKNRNLAMTQFATELGYY